MKKGANERTYHTVCRKIKDFFIRMGRRSRYPLGPAIVGLAVSVFFYHLCEYCRRGSKRFACTVFLLLCFMIGSSFSYPACYVKAYSKESMEENVPAVFADAKRLSGSGQKTGMEEWPRLEECSSPAAIIENETVPLARAYHSFDADDWRLVLINKQHPVPENYSFTLGTIKTVRGDMQCDERIVEDLRSMIQDAGGEEVNLVICSPYRDLARQEVLFNRKIKGYMNKGMSYMEAYKLSSRTVTVPGASEHQIGLAIDIVSDTYTALNEGFAETEAGTWLEEHCAEYGFILRYPRDKEYITSIEFEPWHFRYVGKEAAEVIMEEKLCLEEFWETYIKP